MEEPGTRVATYATIRAEAGSGPQDWERRVLAARDAGAAGVVLEPAGQPPVGSAGSDRCRDAIATLCSGVVDPGRVLVQVGGLREATTSLEAGAHGVVFAPASLHDSDADAVASAAGEAPEGTEVWLPAAFADLQASEGSSGACIVVELRPEALRADHSLPYAAHPVGPPLAVGLPPEVEVGRGALAALTTLAVLAGVRRLRCRDVRFVRRCADVATELLETRAALAGSAGDPSGVGPCR